MGEHKAGSNQSLVSWAVPDLGTLLPPLRWQGGLVQAFWIICPSGSYPAASCAGWMVLCWGEPQDIQTGQEKSQIHSYLKPKDPLLFFSQLCKNPCTCLSLVAHYLSLRFHSSIGADLQGHWDKIILLQAE